MTKILLASNNPGKRSEITALLKDLNLEVLIPSQLGLTIDVVEDGLTYAENAARKGIAFAKASGLLTLADDSGLEVEKLGNAPGIRSARFSPKSGATDADRRAYLLDRLRDQPRPWLASFHCVIVLVTPSGDIHFAEGSCSGEIITQERGLNGFGYDPIFLVQGLGRTMAELDMDEKNRVSHRARAVSAAVPMIKNYLLK